MTSRAQPLRFCGFFAQRAFAWPAFGPHTVLDVQTRFFLFPKYHGLDLFSFFLLLVGLFPPLDINPPPRPGVLLSVGPAWAVLLSLVSIIPDLCAICRVSHASSPSVRVAICPHSSGILPLTSPESPTREPWRPVPLRCLSKLKLHPISGPSSSPASDRCNPVSFHESLFFWSGPFQRHIDGDTFRPVSSPTIGRTLIRNSWVLYSLPFSRQFPRWRA